MVTEEQHNLPTRELVCNQPTKSATTRITNCVLYTLTFVIGTKGFLFENH